MWPSPVMAPNFWVEPEIVNLDMRLHLLNTRTRARSLFEQTHRTNTAELGGKKKKKKPSHATGQLTLKYEQEHVVQGHEDSLALSSQGTALFSSVREGSLEKFV